MKLCIGIKWDFNAATLAMDDLLGNSGIKIISRLLLFFGSTETIPFSIGRTDFQRSISFQNFPELRDKSRNRLILDALSLFQSLLQMIVPGIKEF